MAYASRSSPELGIAAWCWVGTRASEREWERHLADVVALRTWPYRPRRPAVLIHLVDSLFLPNAQQRAQLAEVAAHEHYCPDIAVVTGNPLIRGVILAIEWWRPEHHYKLRPFGTLADAVDWLEAERGSELNLLELLRETHHELGLRV